MFHLRCTLPSKMTRAKQLVVFIPHKNHRTIHLCVEMQWPCRRWYLYFSHMTLLHCYYPTSKKTNSHEPNGDRHKRNRRWKKKQQNDHKIYRGTLHPFSRFGCEAVKWNKLEKKSGKKYSDHVMCCKLSPQTTFYFLFSSAYLKPIQTCLNSNLFSLITIHLTFIIFVVQTSTFLQSASTACILTGIFCHFFFCYVCSKM